MCLAVPTRVTALFDDQTAEVSAGGAVKRVSIALLDEVAVGDHVLVHVGYALQRIDPAEAERTLALMAAEGGAE